MHSFRAQRERVIPVATKDTARNEAVSVPACAPGMATRSRAGGIKPRAGYAALCAAEAPDRSCFMSETTTFSA